MNTLDLNYSSSITKTYWCHICKKEFSKIFIENVDIQCRFCGNHFCEEINPNEELNEHPSSFIPYETNQSHNNTNNNSNHNSSGRRNVSSTTSTSTNTRNSLFNFIMVPRANRPRTTSSLLDMVFNVLRDRNEEENSMENIINYIMQNDPNRYGNPPASKEIVDNLEKIIINEQNIMSLIQQDNCENCSVCKDNFESGQTIIKIPCKHIFHDECIKPWLNERNSCPTCRYELPTDDPDYEARKQI